MAFVATGTTALLIGLAFGAAIAEQPFFSSSRAAIPNLIEDPEDLNWANSLVTIGVARRDRDRSGARRRAATRRSDRAGCSR